MKDVFEEMGKRPKRKFTRNEILVTLLCFVASVCVSVITVYFLAAVSKP